MANPSERLNLIDLSASDEQVAAELAVAYRDVGFAGITNHGVDQHVIDSAFDASRAFHSLPLAQKMAIELNEHHRGFIANEASTDTASEYEEVTTANQSESFMMLGPVPTGRFLDGPNQWPELAEFRDTLQRYHAAMSALATRLIGCFSLVLGESLAPRFDVPTAWLRLLRYPPDAAGYGSAPHRDYGAITLLAQSDVPGLEVLTGSGEWLQVAADPSVLILNTGEVMHRWSNAALLRTPHRVRNHSGRDRYSIPFFFDPDMRSTIEPLASCLTSGERPRFEAQTFESFVRGELQAGYRKHARD